MEVAYFLGAGIEALMPWMLLYFEMKLRLRSGKNALGFDGDNF